MAKPSVIEDYLSALSAELPAPIVEELADGLAETWQRHLGHGLEPDSAADAALAEFGDPSLILAEFTRLSPARRAARRLLVIGPVVGGCWGIALITGRAWSSPVPVAVRLVLGAALLAVIAALAAAALGRRYRSVGKAGAMRLRWHRGDRRCRAHHRAARDCGLDLADCAGHGSKPVPHHHRCSRPAPRPRWLRPAAATKRRGCADRRRPAAMEHLATCPP